MGVIEAQFWIGVHGVIIRDDARILVLRRDPAMLYRPGHWDLPGGHLAADEDIHDCLRREIIEETGLKVNIGRLVGFNKASDGPYVQMFFACKACEPVREIKLRLGEHDAAQWLTIGEIGELPTLIPYLAATLSRGMLNGIEF